MHLIIFCSKCTKMFYEYFFVLNQRQRQILQEVFPHDKIVITLFIIIPRYLEKSPHLPLTPIDTGQFRLAFVEFNIHRVSCWWHALSQVFISLSRWLGLHWRPRWQSMVKPQHSHRSRLCPFQSFKPGPIVCQILSFFSFFFFCPRDFVCLYVWQL